MDGEDEKDFCIERAKTGRASCKKCKRFCEKGEFRIARLVPNHFSEGAGKLKHWYHIDCLLEAFKNQRASTRKIDSVDDIDGWNDLSEEDQQPILQQLIKCCGEKVQESKNVSASFEEKPTSSFCQKSDDNLFATFTEICKEIAGVSGYNEKSQILHKFLKQGTDKKRFEGDINLWIKFMLPSIDKRIYNLKSRQLVKLFSRIFSCSHQKMLTDLEQGDIAETIRKNFDMSKFKHTLNSKLTMQEVDNFLEELSKHTREEDQIKCFEKLCNVCCSEDIKMIIRLISYDLRMNAGPRHILDAIHPSAYEAFQTSRDLSAVIEKYYLKEPIKLSPQFKKATANVQVMIPVSPMLAEACKSVETAISKNPNGAYCEIKYDGERVQIHKKGNEFRFFTRNLKPVMDHKIRRCKEFIPKAFPGGYDMILDSEIILIDTVTGKLLPFGTLGIHKKEQFVKSEVCLFVFDCIYYNGEDLTKRPLLERKRILEQNMNSIKNHVQLSEYYLINTEKQLAAMTAKVLKRGLEGLVLKDIKSEYQPGKRGWLKIKKDYLFEGKMADSADLVVLGAWFGTGKKGGMLSIFLMGCLDKQQNVWKTVTKVHSGLDDNEMEKLQDELGELMQRSKGDKLPEWLRCKKILLPDYIAIDPLVMPVWEITGAEFSKADAHTADGISIRFPRITKIRSDKSPNEATTLEELKALFNTSKEYVNVEMLLKNADNDETIDVKTEFLDLNQIKPSTSYYIEAVAEDVLPASSRKRGSAETPTKRDDISPKNRKRNSVNTLTKCNDLPSKHENVENSGNISPKKVQKTSSQGCSVQQDQAEKYNRDKTKMFENVKLYVPLDVDEKFAEVSKKFKKRGGEVVDRSHDATHVLHLTNQTDESFLNIRKKYKPESRHLTYNWIFESIIENCMVSQQDFAVYV